MTDTAVISFLSPTFFLPILSSVITYLLPAKHHDALNLYFLPTLVFHSISRNQHGAVSNQTTVRSEKCDSSFRLRLKSMAGLATRGLEYVRGMRTECVRNK